MSNKWGVEHQAVVGDAAEMFAMTRMIIQKLAIDIGGS